MPGIPVTETRRARRSREVAWSRSLMRRSSSSRPTKGGSRRSERPTPFRCATTRSARQAWTTSSLPFSCRAPTAVKAIAPEAARQVDSSTRTAPGGATLWTLEAALTVSPSTIPSDTLPTVIATSPVTTPARAARSTPDSLPSSATDATTSRAARTDRSASSSFATGAPHTAMTASPMNFSTVPP